MIVYKILLVLFIGIFPITAFSQQVTGRVYASDENTLVPLPGVNIVWQGTFHATVSDSTGYFRIEKNDSSPALIFSFVGYKNDTVKVTGNKPLKIVLSEKHQLKEVTISEGHIGTSISGVTPINQEKISMTEIKRAACCNLSESFETNATVDVNYADAVTGAKEIRMLGLEGSYTQLLTENVPAVRGLAAPFGLSYISGQWLESIQISKGAGSVVNGYESITGQINTEYKKPIDGEKLFANLYVNSLGRTEGNLDAGKQFTPKVGTMLFLSGSFFGTRVDANHDGFLDLPKVSQFNAMNRWRFDVGKYWEIQAVVKGLYEDRTGGQWAFDKNKSVFDQSAYGVHITTKRMEGFLKTARIFQGSLDRSMGWINSIVYHDQQGWYGHNQYNGRETNWYSNLIFQTYLRNPMHTFKSGASFVLDDYREQLNSVPYDRNELVPGIFSEYTFNYHDHITLLAGLRGDYHNLYGVFISPRLHFKWNPVENTTIRLSGGRGYHVANIFAENTGVLISSRQLVVQEALKPEVAWNFGGSFTQKFTLGKRLGTFNLDLYHTRFENQVIMDLDADNGKALFYNLKGQSYSTSLQVELSYEPVKGLTLKAAYKFNDVRTTYQGTLQEKLLVPRHRGLLSAAYTTPNTHWKFDATGQLTGTSRLPDNFAALNDGQIKNGRSPIFPTISVQVTFVWKRWEVYFGGENLTGFTEKTPIIGWEKPFTNTFDASSTWGPLYAQTFYLGMRFTWK